MVSELSFVSIDWIKPLWKKLNKTWASRNKELDELGNVFGDPRLLAKYYVEPNCQHHNPANYDEDHGPRSYVKTPIFTTLNAFLNESQLPQDGRNHLFVLADAGMGKTSLLIMLKLSQLLDFWPKSYECLLLKLGADTLERAGKHKNKTATVLLLDALDEDPTAFGRMNERLQELIQNTLTFRHVVISCRTQFFPKPEQDAFDRDGRVTVANYTCPMVFVSFFDDRQVRQYLLKRFPNPWHHGLSKRQDPKFLKAETMLAAMKSLRFRPLLLAHVEDLLQANHKAWDSYHVYQALIKTWLRREVSKMQQQALSNIPDELQLWHACRLLAVYLQSQDKRALPESELKLLIQRLPMVQNLEHLDFGGRSLLNRTSGLEYRFAHYSIQEFFVVDTFVTDILQGALALSAPTNSAPTKLRATVQMWDFLSESGAKFTALANFFYKFDCNNLNLKPIGFRAPLAASTPGLEMVAIPPGDYVMGDAQHGGPRAISITKPFALGRFPVTFAEYDCFCLATARNRPADQGWGREQRPVINISWEDAQAYCVWLSNCSGCSFRLPSEAEWEYACRAGTNADFFWGDDVKLAGDYAWFEANSNGKTHPVGEKTANPWGLYDMTGNVWEWVEDAWRENYMDVACDGSTSDGETEGDLVRHVLRGGSWNQGPQVVRSSNRYRGKPSLQNDLIGFRLAQDLV